jgi:hypothetical protein
MHWASGRSWRHCVAGTRRIAWWVATVLALLWLWTGIAYHWLAFAAINRAAWVFGALFVAEATLLV